MKFLNRVFQRTRYRKCKYLPLYHDFERVYWDNDGAQRWDDLSDEQTTYLFAGKFPWEDCSSFPNNNNVDELGRFPIRRIDYMAKPRPEEEAIYRNLLRTERPEVLQANQTQWNQDGPRLRDIRVAGITANTQNVADITERWIQRIFLEQPMGVPPYTQGHDRVMVALYAKINSMDEEDGEELCAYFRKLFLALDVILVEKADPANFLMLLPGSVNTIVHHDASEVTMDRYPYFTTIVTEIFEKKTDPLTLATNIKKLQIEMEKSPTLAKIRQKIDGLRAPGVEKCLMYRRASSQKRRKSRGQQSSRMSSVRTGTARPYRARDRGLRRRGSRDPRRSNTSAGLRQRRSRLRRPRRS